MNDQTNENVMRFHHEAIRFHEEAIDKLCGNAGNVVDNLAGCAVMPTPQLVEQREFDKLKEQVAMLASRVGWTHVRLVAHLKGLVFFHPEESWTATPEESLYMTKKRHHTHYEECMLISPKDANLWRLRFAGRTIEEINQNWLMRVRDMIH